LIAGITGILFETGMVETLWTRRFGNADTALKAASHCGSAHPFGPSGVDFEIDGDIPI
jgi:hypothetical protein